MTGGRAVIWGIVMVVGIAILTESRTLAEVEAALVVVTLLALWGLNYASRRKG